MISDFALSFQPLFHPKALPPNTLQISAFFSLISKPARFAGAALRESLIGQGFSEFGVGTYR
jgi:hypothetical protein